MATKVLFIGLDSLDPTLLNQMLDEKKLNGLSKLRDRAHVWPIENFTPFGAGAYWPAIATALNPAHHGRYFFYHFRKDLYRMTRFDDTRDFKSIPLWKKLDQQGHKAAVIDWPRGPVHEMNHGLFFGSWFSHDHYGQAISRPEPEASEIIRQYGKDPFEGSVCGYVHDVLKDYNNPKTYTDVTDILIKRIATKTKMTCDYIDSNDWDVFMQVFGEAHDIGHLAWHLHDALDGAYDADLARKVGRDVIEDVNLALDEAVSELLAHVGSDTQVIMTCGPGMRSLETGNGFLGEVVNCLDLGIELGKEATRVQKINALMQKIPSFKIRMLFYPFLSRIRGALETLDLKDRRFFAVPHNHNAGAIRLNVKGREPNGVIEPGKDYDDLCAQITKDLMDITIKETGEPLVAEVVRPRDNMSGPHLDELPDLFVAWNREVHITDATSPKIGDIKYRGPKRTGDHTPFGEIWSTHQPTGMIQPGNTIKPDVAGRIVADCAQSAMTTKEKVEKALDVEKALELV